MGIAAVEKPLHKMWAWARNMFAVKNKAIEHILRTIYTLRDLMLNNFFKDVPDMRKAAEGKKLYGKPIMDKIFELTGILKKIVGLDIESLAKKAEQNVKKVKHMTLEGYVNGLEKEGAVKDADETAKAAANADESEKAAADSAHSADQASNAADSATGNADIAAKAAQAATAKAAVVKDKAGADEKVAEDKEVAASADDAAQKSVQNAEVAAGAANSASDAAGEAKTAATDADDSATDAKTAAPAAGDKP